MWVGFWNSAEMCSRFGVMLQNLSILFSALGDAQLGICTRDPIKSGKRKQGRRLGSCYSHETGWFLGFTCWLGGLEDGSVGRLWGFHFKALICLNRTLRVFPYILASIAFHHQISQINVAITCVNSPHSSGISSSTIKCSFVHRVLQRELGFTIF